jgi:uncharacterized protein
MTRIGLLSDTHGFLPKAVFEHFKDVDEIWHAGDIGTVEVSNQLEAFKPLKAVWGNIDGQDIRIRFPEHLFFTIENVPVLIMHIGYPPKYNAESKKLIAQYKPHLFICGHSHILKVMPDGINNLLHINPGACGKQGWHKVSTLIRLTIDGDRVSNLEVIELAIK